jgi:hypothetical protein
MPQNLTQTSSISINSNPLDGTLFPPLIKAVGEYWDQSMTIELKNNLVLGMNLLVISFVIYIIWLLLSRFLELRKPRHYLKVTFDHDLDENEGYDSQILGLVSGLHTLAKSSVITFELHKSKDFTGFLFSSSDQSVLNHIKSELSRVGCLGVEVLTSKYEPLTYQFIQYKEKVTSRPYQLQMIASQEYGNFRKDQLDLTRNLIGTMQSIPKDQFGSVVFAFRPVIKEFKIKSKVAKLEYKIMKDSKEYAVNPGINKEIAQLEEKNQYDMFATRITVAGSSRQIVDSLSASFNIISAQNSFKSRLSNFKLSQFRFIPKENIFKLFNRNAFGSLLNIRELTSLVQLSQFQNLSKIRNDEKNLETIETKVENISKVDKKVKLDQAKDSTNSKENSEETNIDSQNAKIDQPKPANPVKVKTIIKLERVKVKKFPRLPEEGLEIVEIQEQSKIQEQSNN